ncbi:S-adenosyl-L-methionine-dependent methyltransferase [Hesseltinella vesiculosa]|uniref:S-adenosyl-L-methionine-dependent methyltransferase n=1 Tax=Hesseltinella vesiculosa TaxID=101127 RepID=A0A1X2GQU6_9FUNG|nr:S-adenosyl-L-methionine-dependent methyltransferase [Hesseltinella vesiculosa]
MTQPIRCLEFFSGIGGLHYALNIAGIDAEVVECFDINQVANKVYEHNFGKKTCNKTIERLTVADINKQVWLGYDADAWLLSPPCQPYTQGGKALDDQDPRAQPLLHLLNLMPKLKKQPRFLFLENVKNFETSRTRKIMMERLKDLGYDVTECLLSPVDFGIPNHRLRYYMAARLGPTQQERPLYKTWPFTSDACFESPLLDTLLEPLDKEDRTYDVPARSILRLHNFRLDIVQPSDSRTSCVTKSYGSHHIVTSGSLVQTKHLETTDYQWHDPASLVDLGLRFLTPTEVARLHAFPLPPYSDQQAQESTTGTPRSFVAPNQEPYLSFPNDITVQQRYRLLGNSLNCWVVAELYRCILFLE